MNPGHLPISVCMISGAEARRIERSLASVADWVSEIVVVLNADTADGTDQIVKQYGGQVFRERWKGNVAQKNSAAQKAAQPWLLGLDADEVISPDLKAEIALLFSQEASLGQYAAFSFPRCTFYCGKWIKHGDWYPDRNTRLWRKGMGEWAGVDPHGSVQVRGAIGPLKCDLLHFSQESLNHQVAKTVLYADEFVRTRLAGGGAASAFDLVLRPLWRFIRAYFFRLGFLDGWQGYTIAWMTAFYTFLRYAKVREKQMPSQSPP